MSALAAVRLLRIRQGHSQFRADLVGRGGSGSSSEQGWRYRRDLCRRIKKHHFVLKKSVCVGQERCSRAVFPVLLLLGSGHTARWFLCHWAGVAEPLWKLWNVAQCGSYLPASVLHHSNIVFPHEPVFPLKPLPSLLWQNTPTCVAGYCTGSQLNGCWEKLGCIWTCYNFRK